MEVKKAISSSQTYPEGVSISVSCIEEEKFGDLGLDDTAEISWLEKSSPSSPTESSTEHGGDKEWRGIDVGVSVQFTESVKVVGVDSMRAVTVKLSEDCVVSRMVEAINSGMVLHELMCTN